MSRYAQQAVNKFQHGIKSPNKAIDAPHPYKATKKQGLPMTHPTTGNKTSPTDRGYFPFFIPEPSTHNAHRPEHHCGGTNTGNPNYQRKG